MVGSWAEANGGAWIRYEKPQRSVVREVIGVYACKQLRATGSLYSNLARVQPEGCSAKSLSATLAKHA